jgi:hypothetical protein
VKVAPATKFYTAVRKLREDQRELVMTMFDLHLKAQLSVRPSRMRKALDQMHVLLKAIKSGKTGSDDLYSTDGAINTLLRIVKDDRQRKDSATGRKKIQENNQGYADRKALIQSAKFKEEWESLVGMRSEKEKIIAMRHGIKPGTVQRRVSRLKRAGKLTD